MALTQFPEPPSLKILEIGDSQDHRKMVYTVENPHPMYGKDPNIINELGHTIYPKFIYPQGKDQPGVIVNNPMEEAQLLDKEVVEVKDEHKELVTKNVLSEIEELRAKLAKAEALLDQHHENHSTDENGHPWGK